MPSVRLLSGLLVLLCLPRPVAASYGFYVGKNLTKDGSVLIGGTGEEVSSHWLEIVAAREYGTDATITVGVTDEANLPGELMEIPQVPRTAKYISMFYTEYKGSPPPLTNGGLNEHGVAVRDVWSPSRTELVDMTPRPQRGPNYSDLSRIVLERAQTAREGVEIIGALIAEHGHSTYGGNSHLIADAEEGWVVIQPAGGVGLWAAQRLGPDDIRVSYPGYIGEIPLDYLEHPDFMGSENLVTFAVEQGWYAPNEGRPLNFHEVYGRQDLAIGDGGYKFVDSMTLENDLRALAPEIRLQDLMAAVRDPRIANEEAGYGQVAALREEAHPELRVLWVAPTGSVTAPFIPYPMGAERVLPEYGRHRYLTKDAGRTFLAEDYQAREATEFAGRVFKRLMYYTCERPEKFLPEVTEALEAFEARALAELPQVGASALALHGQDLPELARDLLSRYAETKAAEGLALGKALLASIEARTKILYGIREPQTDRINEPAVAGRTIISCLTSRDHEGPFLSPADTPARPPEIVASPVPAPPPAPTRNGFGPWIPFAIGIAIGGTVGLVWRRRARHRVEP